MKILIMPVTLAMFVSLAQAVEVSTPTESPALPSAVGASVELPKRELAEVKAKPVQVRKAPAKSSETLASKKDQPASVENETINMSEPPFLMSSYDEFKDLQAEQKSFYVEKLSPILVKVPSMKSTKAGEVQAATEWYKDWDRLRKRLYVYCHDEKAAPAQALCEQAADLRIEALEMNGNKKKENREAASEDDDDDEDGSLGE